MFWFTNEMRRARLGSRHLLTDTGTDTLEVAHSLVALHSSDPATVYLTVQARVSGFEIEDLEKVMYETRDLVRIYGMRRTLWVVDRTTMPLVDRSSTNQIAAANRRRFEKMLEDGGLTEDGPTWADRVMAKTLGAVHARGEALAKDLTGDVPELANKLEFHNKKGELIGSTGVSTRALVQLGLESKIIRGRPIGSWISSQYRWAVMEDWLGEAVPETAPDHAAASLIKRWLTQFGPGTTTDIKWWTGWTVARVKKALEDVGAVEVRLDDGVGWMLPGDLGEAAPATDWVALLPSLDPTTMGWKERGWYLGDHGPVLFDRNGNAGPTVWVNGQVVGGWAQRKTGEIVYEILDDIGRETTEDVGRKASMLEQWMGEVMVTPRFRSPHDKQLSQ